MKFFLSLLLMVFLIGCRLDSPVELPKIAIHIDDDISWDSKKPCKISYKYQDVKKEMTGVVKYRGGHSSRYHKKSITLELDSKYSLGLLPKDDDWVLNANYIDKTFMRHALSFEIFRQMSPKNIAPNTTFVTLEINGEYNGLYVLMEEVDAGLLDINKKDVSSVLYKDPPVFRKDTIIPQDKNNYYQQKFPDINKQRKDENILAFQSFIRYTDDTTFYNNIGDWIDLDNVVDWHLILLLTNNSDGILKNFYLYKKNDQTPYRISIWDYDHSFGRDGDYELNMMDRKIDCNRSILFSRLSGQTTYNQKLQNRYIELRTTGLLTKNNLFLIVDQYNDILMSNIDKNAQKWPLNAKWYFDDNTYRQEVKILKDFILLRLEQLDKELNYTKKPSSQSG